MAGVMRYEVEVYRLPPVNAAWRQERYNVRDPYGEIVGQFTFREDADLFASIRNAMLMGRGP